MTVATFVQPSPAAPPPPLLRRLQRSGIACAPGTLAGYRGAHPARSDATPAGIAYPRTTEEVVSLLRWARKTKTPLSTFSSPPGARHRGATVKVEHVIADLSRMNQVRYIDARDAIAVIEPGVTFQALDAALAPHGLRSFRPLAPRAGKSALTAYLEREPLLQAREHWDTLDPLGGAEIVFGTGERFKTGSAASRGSLAEQWQAGLRFLTAMGPIATDFMRVVQGAQGTLGIVTWAAVMCERIPARETCYFAGCATLAPLVKLTYRLQRRRLADANFIVNAFQLATLLARTPGEIRALAARLPPWIMFASLVAGDELPDAQMAWQEADLQAEAAALGLTLQQELAGHAAAALLRRDAPPAQHYADRVSGAHRSVFFLTQLDRAQGFVDTAHRLAHGHALADTEIGVYLQPRLHGRNAHLAFTVPDQPGAGSGPAAAFARELATRCCETGGFFSRPYGPWAAMAYARHKQIEPYMQHAKQLFDPDALLNPGRLCFSTPHSERDIHDAPRQTP